MIDSHCHLDHEPLLNNLDQIIKVRYLDDAGKNPSMKTPDFEYFAPMIKRLIEKHEKDQNI